ncbi:MAG: hypothetical protein AAGG02_12240 [Cyanobacteria bacterium P01_H01_bin.15]
MKLVATAGTGVNVQMISASFGKNQICFEYYLKSEGLGNSTYTLKKAIEDGEIPPEIEQDLETLLEAIAKWINIDHAWSDVILKSIKLSGEFYDRLSFGIVGISNDQLGGGATVNSNKIPLAGLSFEKKRANFFQACAKFISKNESKKKYDQLELFDQKTSEKELTVRV